MRHILVARYRPAMLVLTRMLCVGVCSLSSSVLLVLYAPFPFVFSLSFLSCLFLRPPPSLSRSARTCVALCRRTSCAGWTLSTWAPSLSSPPPAQWDARCLELPPLHPFPHLKEQHQQTAEGHL